jgi:hypothetical protein
MYGLDLLLAGICLLEVTVFTGINNGVAHMYLGTGAWKYDT